MKNIPLREVDRKARGVIRKLKPGVDFWKAGSHAGQPATQDLIRLTCLLRGRRGGPLCARFVASCQSIRFHLLFGRLPRRLFGNHLWHLP